MKLLPLSLLFIALALLTCTLFGCAGVTAHFETKEFQIPAMMVRVVDSSDKMPPNCAAVNADGCAARRKGLWTVYVKSVKQDGKFVPSEWVTGHEVLHVLSDMYPDYFIDPDRIGKFGFSDE